MERSERVDDCGCKLMRDETGLRMVDCPLHKAAPDLLEACERVVAYLKIHDSNYWESNSDARKLEQAIAKATKEG